MMALDDKKNTAALKKKYLIQTGMKLNTRRKPGEYILCNMRAGFV